MKLNICRSLIHGGSQDAMLIELQQLRELFLLKNNEDIKISLAISEYCGETEPLMAEQTEPLRRDVIW